MIAGLNAFRATMTRVKQSLQSGSAAAAIPILKQLIASNDRSYEVHLALRRCIRRHEAISATRSTSTRPLAC